MSAHLKCFSSLCSVLDLNAFERQNKAEGLGMVSEEGTSKSLEHYNIIIYSSSAFPATFEGSDCTGTYSISECFCCCLSSSISILEGCDIVIT